MAILEDYLTEDDRADLLEAVEEIYYRGEGTVEICIFNHKVVDVRSTKSRRKRKCQDYYPSRGEKKEANNQSG